ncbi:DUF3732 domain-containing protein [Burkholderia contaminans]|uniref:DUF3732 domain-containing protein n=1 Tax=Burkholderia contaminans TaxID=488447 RepID=A0A3N8PNL0_9BURK|nr:DUF3732 domain-containing protein [Burkholderia contaminans]
MGANRAVCIGAKVEAATEIAAADIAVLGNQVSQVKHTFLALHEYFTGDERVNGPVFSYLAIDQPSQVYFPSTYSGENILDGFKDQAQGLSGNRDNDVRQTRLIFIALARGLQRSKLRYQTIVVEHADKTIWGNGKWGRHMHEVADWKDEGKSLIPAEWFD